MQTIENWITSPDTRTGKLYIVGVINGKDTTLEITGERDLYPGKTVDTSKGTYKLGTYLIAT